ncbi:MAG: hypothetical protein AAGH64_04305, partial [Planctomycetota bacterium]
DPGLVIDRLFTLNRTPGDDLIFLGRLVDGQTGQGQPFGDRVWRFDNPGFTELTRNGLVAPGTNGARFAGIDYQETLAGDAGTTGTLVLGEGDATPMNNTGFWLEDAGTLTLRVRTGSPALGVPEAVIDQFNGPFKLAASGGYTFEGTVSGPGITPGVNNTCLWASQNGAINLVLQQGEPVAGIPKAVVGPILDTPVTPVRADGSFLASTDIVVSPGTTASETLETIWLVTQGGKQRLVTTGDPAAGTVDGAFFGFQAPPVWLDNSDIIYAGELDAMSQNGVANGLWRIRAGMTLPLVFNGDAAPGTGGTFSRFLSLDSRANTVLFTAQLDGTPDPQAGIASAWLATAGQLIPVTNTDGSVPGLPGNIFIAIAETDVNASGDAVLRAFAKDDIFAPGPSTEGIWAYSSASQRLILVALKGEPFDLSACRNGSDPRVVSSFVEISEIREDGSFSFTAAFDDGTVATFLHSFAPAQNACSGDFDCSGSVGLGDFGVFGAAFGSLVSDTNYLPAADFDNDGDIDLGDFGVFASQFGSTAAECLPGG